ncbi:MAG TPA: hypothetical protein VKH15_08275 [Candidatus Acidoferrum sp.]|nr:hypothetical protein [Candidatus Acidoferrum sp.]
MTRRSALTATTGMPRMLARLTATMGRVGSLVAFSSAQAPGSVASAAGIGAVAGLAGADLVGEGSLAAVVSADADLKADEAGLLAAEPLDADRLAVDSAVLAVGSTAVQADSTAVEEDSTVVEADMVVADTGN